MVFALVVVLSASPAKVAMPGLNGVKLEPAEVSLYGEVLASRLGAGGLSVVTSRDIASVLGLERQRQLLGCADSGEGLCLAELSGALGVEFLLVGDLARLGSGFLVTLKVLSTRSGQTMARFEGQGSDMLEVLGRAAVQLCDTVLGPAAPRFSRLWAVVPGALAIAALSVGVWSELQSDHQLRALRGAATILEAQHHAESGKAFEILGHSLMGVGAAAVAAAVVLLVFGESPVQPVASWGSTGPSFGLAGVWP